MDTGEDTENQDTAVKLGSSSDAETCHRCWLLRKGPQEMPQLQWCPKQMSPPRAKQVLLRLSQGLEAKSRRRWPKRPQTNKTCAAGWRKDWPASHKRPTSKSIVGQQGKVVSAKVATTSRTLGACCRGFTIGKQHEPGSVLRKSEGKTGRCHVGSNKDCDSCEKIKGAYRQSNIDG
ncbi:hypothetical protein MRX96_033335 [Rhipicephalus microplus]